METEEPGKNMDFEIDLYRTISVLTFSVGFKKIGVL